MRCPMCGFDNDKVLESRSSTDGESIRRRRECLNCGYRFTSYEKIENRPIIVVKKDLSHQAFDITKIDRGIRKCMEKVNIEDGEIERILAKVEERIYRLAGSKNMITSKEVGEAILKELHNVSPVAYVRFASVYRAFSNVKEFIKEIERFDVRAKEDKEVGKKKYMRTLYARKRISDRAKRGK